VTGKKVSGVIRARHGKVGKRRGVARVSVVVAA
jgi:hypothetical protein